MERMIINSAVMDSIVNKLLITVLFCISCFSCIAQKENYASLLKPESIDSENDVIFGFLKKDITVETPYGKMEVPAIGYESGYFFDFAYYVNGNLAKIWLRNEKTIIYDTMIITLPSFEPDKLLCIDFFDNFNIKTCKAKNEVTYLGVKLPANICLHFNKDGTLRSFTLYQDWYFENVLFLDGQQFYIVEGKIVPWK
jgi:hypothetical protein